MNSELDRFDPYTMRGVGPTHANIEHDDADGAPPVDVTAQDENDFARSLHMRQARARALDRDGWIADEFEILNRELMRLAAIKRPKGKQTAIYFVSAAEVLKAFDSKVIDRNEARKVLGLGRKRQPAQLRKRAK